MGDEETITVAEESEGLGGTGDVGKSVDLPVVEILTGRGFITGKSGSGKSNTASVVVEKLLDNQYSLLIVDIDGEYYGLKEEYEILHVGGDEECDIQIEAEHAEKLASLALDQNVPIILDISSYLNEEEASELLTEVAKQLFAKEKKIKKPFLLIVEEVHEFLPEGGGMDECGRMLIKIAKRGRKHGLGITGISQRPADVKKDFITQCDWLTWHRLTWNNDTKVVGRVLDNEYADAVEDLDDGEGFLMTDWNEAIRRVQFQRKQTFDAGATPGLGDFERPDLKSVSGDLVSELEDISDEKQKKEDQIAELKEELNKKNSRIAELEKELSDARDMRRMADQFVDALLQQADRTNPGRTEAERMREYNPQRDGAVGKPDASASNQKVQDGESVGQSANGSQPATESSDSAEAEASGAAESEASQEESTTAEAEGADASDDATEESEEGQPAVAGGASTTSESQADGGTTVAPAFGPVQASQVVDTAEGEVTEDSTAETSADEVSTDDASDDGTRSWDAPTRIVAEVLDELARMEPQTRQMLRYYREQGPGTPVDAHFASGGSGDRTQAYSYNRRLRTRDLVEHVGRGSYDDRLRTYLNEEHEHSLDDEQLTEYAAVIDRELRSGDL
jgi:hypothetical protein